jgi:Ca2+-binding RTX toxin-like protein
MVGNDILFGDAQDDDIIGGYGHDWISGGTGSDGVLGDDGRIYSSRNGVAESLYGIVALTSEELDLLISTPGNFQQSTINVNGELKKSVNLTPFNIDPAGFQNPLYVTQYADDIIYGGLGGDFLHGGSEALSIFYNSPENNGDVLSYGTPRGGEFAAYDEFNPLSKVFVDENGEFDPTGLGAEFLLNFDAFDAEAPTTGETDTNGAPVQTDGDDRIFGDLGNDWLVGGTGKDHLFGGWGDDLLNADDNHETNNGANDQPDGPVASYQRSE